MRMILMALAGLLFACGQPVRSESDTDRNLHYAVKIGEQYGAINQRGDLVLPPQPRPLNSGSDLNPTPGGLLWFEGDGDGDNDLRYGLMDITGKIIVAAKYPEVRPFSRGLAWVCTFADPEGESPRRWTVIDLTGRERFEPRPYKEVFEFTEHGAWVDRWDPDAPCMIDGDGQQIFTPPTATWWTSPAYEGLAAFNDRTLGKYGFVDRAGHVVIAPRFDETGDFSEGKCWVRVDGRWDESETIAHWTGGRMGFIDRTGNWLFSVHADVMWDFKEGRAAIFSRTAGWGLVDDRGHLVIPLQRDISQFGAFSEGLAPALTSAGWGLIDRSGKWAVTPRFFEIGYWGFRGGVALVWLTRQGKQVAGWIDRQGRWVIPPGSNGGSHRNGLLQMNDRSMNPIGYTDLHYRYVWPPEKRGQSIMAENADPADRVGAEAR